MCPVTGPAPPPPRPLPRPVLRRPGEVEGRGVPVYEGLGTSTSVPGDTRSSRDKTTGLVSGRGGESPGASDGLPSPTRGGGGGRGVGPDPHRSGCIPRPSSTPIGFSSDPTPPRLSGLLPRPGRAGPVWTLPRGTISNSGWGPVSVTSGPCDYLRGSWDVPCAGGSVPLRWFDRSTSHFSGVVRHGGWPGRRQRL